MVRKLRTVEDVVKALGGNAATARLTGKKSQHVWNWKAANKLPAWSYLTLSQKLESSGYTAPPALWGMTEPAEAAQ